MIKDESRSFQLANLKGRDDVMKEITACEERLKRLVQGQVALIAYVKRESAEKSV